MASLKQIAAELGVSYSLVSKVLSGRMGVTGASAATREAILKKARELDYRPNLLAVALRSGNRGAVGVFLHKMGVPGSELSDNFLKGISRSLDESGKRLWLRFFEEDKEFLAACDEKLQHSVDGLIVGGVDHAGLIGKFHQIDKGGLPVVTALYYQHNRLLRSNVCVDYEMQTYLATRHLLENGCSHLAHFRKFELRYRGFLRAHAERGVTVRRSLVIPAEDFSVEEGVACTMRLLALSKPCDGIVAGSDAQAAGALRVLLQRGIQVPGDIRLTGVDDSPLARTSVVPLTSATGEMEKCGSIAAEMLLKRIYGEKVKPVTISPALVIRESSS